MKNPSLHLTIKDPLCRLFLVYYRVGTKDTEWMVALDLDPMDILQLYTGNSFVFFRLSGSTQRGVYASRCHVRPCNLLLVRYTLLHCTVCATTISINKSIDWSIDEEPDASHMDKIAFLALSTAMVTQLFRQDSSLIWKQKLCALQFLGSLGWVSRKRRRKKPRYLLHLVAWETKEILD